MNTRKTVITLLLLPLFACEYVTEEPDISRENLLILAPTNGSYIETNRINFNWQPIEDARSYHFQIAQPNFENTNQILMDSIILQDTTGLIAAKIENISLPNSTYSWRIKGFNGVYETLYATAEFKVLGDENIDFTPPNTPKLIMPSNGASLTEAITNFTWERIDSFGSSEIDSIYIYSDIGLSVLELKGLGVNKTFSANLNPDAYYWLVQSFDNEGNKSDFSTIFNFTIN